MLNTEEPRTGSGSTLSSRSLGTYGITLPPSLTTRNLGSWDLFGNIGRAADNTLGYVPNAINAYNPPSYNTPYNTATRSYGQEPYQQPGYTGYNTYNQPRGIPDPNQVNPNQNQVNPNQVNPNQMNPNQMNPNQMNPNQTQVTPGQVPDPKNPNQVPDPRNPNQRPGDALDGSDSLHVAVYQNGIDKPGIVTAGINAVSNVAKATVHTAGALGDAGLELVGGALSSAEGGVGALRSFFNY